MPRLILTPGDPAGIGPEITARALAERPRDALVVGDWQALWRASQGTGLRLAQLAHPAATAPAGHVGVYEPPPADRGERVELRAIRWAAQHLLAGHPGALVTGPIHKGRLVASGFAFTGHTDFLGHLCGVDHPVMAFVGGRLRVALVTVHLPLAKVPQALTPELLAQTLRTTHAALQHDLGLPHPTLLVCGLNPPAGDDGALGHEEQTLIGPTLDRLRAEGLDLVGPISAEAAFHRMGQGEGDLIVAMYHDQGLAPLKAVDFGRSVNWTLGLPILRTSVDHGTADALVGTGQARTDSLHAALDWAEALVARRFGVASGPGVDRA